LERGVNIRLIIEGCLNGNSGFQRKLFNSFYSYVKSICIRYSGSSTEADEMLNDTFYKVFKYLDRYDNSREFKPWLSKVCVNACLEYNRKYLKKIRFVEYKGELTDQWSKDIPSEIDIPKILQLLSPAYRVVFNLYVMEEYKHQEIAQMLGISVNTSKSNLHRAKQQLREKLEKYKTSSKLKFL